MSMQAAERHAREHVEREDFEAAMRALAELRPAVDAFFDKVTVNADDPELRKNRLKLLNMLRRATLAVADFSKIGGRLAPFSQREKVAAKQPDEGLRRRRTSKGPAVATPHPPASRASLWKRVAQTPLLRPAAEAACGRRGARRCGPP